MAAPDTPSAGIRDMGPGTPPGFGELLRAYRVAAELSREDLAARAGLSPRGVSDLERGARRSPRLETIRLLADALGLAGPDRAAFLAAARPAPTAEDGSK